MERVLPRCVRYYYSALILSLAVQEHGYYGTQAGHYCRLCQALNYDNKEEKIINSLDQQFGSQQCRQSFVRGMSL